MKNDQWFEPGDKVIKVQSLGLKNPIKPDQCYPKTDKGVMYCVRECWKGAMGYNLITLVGFPKIILAPCGRPYGVLAMNFRKVEEIKLCIAALKPQSVKTESVKP